MFFIYAYFDKLTNWELYLICENCSIKINTYNKLFYYSINRNFFMLLIDVDNNLLTFIFFRNLLRTYF